MSAAEPKITDEYVRTWKYRSELSLLDAFSVTASYPSGMIMIKSEGRGTVYTRGEDERGVFIGMYTSACLWLAEQESISE